MSVTICIFKIETSVWPLNMQVGRY